MKEFLLNNYIWILVVILLSIITVIGFLADKKRDKSKKNAPVQPQPMPINNQQVQTPINYQPNINQQPLQTNMNNNQMITNNNMGVNDGFNPNQNNPINLGALNNTSVSPISNQVNNNSNNMATIPADNFNQVNITNNPSSIPLGTNENVSVIPTPVNNIEPTLMNGIEQNNMNFNNMQPIDNNYNQTQPQPVAVDNLNQMENQKLESIYQPLSEQKPTFEPREVNIPVINENTMINQEFNNPNNNMNNMENLNNDMSFNNQVNNINGVNNFGQIAPQPVPSNPTPTPMQPSNNIPNPIPEPQPVIPQPVNFVYGPQQSNNNQFM